MNTHHHHYLRLLRTFALATLTAAAVAACTDDNGDRESLTPDDGNGGIPVTFTADINPADAPGTRTALKHTDDNGFTVEWKGKDTYTTDFCDKIYIWAAQGNTLANSGDEITYVPTTSGASSGLEPQIDNQKLTLPSGGEWTFTAVYALKVMWTGGFGITVSPLEQTVSDSFAHIAARDFSVATATQTVDAHTAMPQSINLRFKHQLSALQLHVTNQSDEALNIKEIRLAVTGEQIADYRNYDVGARGLKVGTENKSDYLTLEIRITPTLPSDGTVQNFHMLLFPGYENKKLTITLITDRGEYALTKPAPTGGFTAGTNYTTNIAIKTSGLDPDTETWTEVISNKAELVAFRNKVNNGDTYQEKIVRLTADIDLTGETWTPIGNSSNRFSGTFEGGGYLISNLSVNNGSNYHTGLFGYVYRGTVRNLRVSGGKVKTFGAEAGGITGTLDNSTVENCIFDGTVSGVSSVGGIAGYSYNDSRIAGCYTKGQVTSTNSNAGGIAGHNMSAINCCYSEAEVATDKKIAGGIVGQNDMNGIVTHCYATGRVMGNSFVGGIAGSDSNGTLTGCLALNPILWRVEGSETSFGRIAGSKTGVNNCFAYGYMTIKDLKGDITATTGHTGIPLLADDCLSVGGYTTNSGFPVATATTPGWAFDPATPWTYLPWNPAFASFPGITEADYRIGVPAHLANDTN